MRTFHVVRALSGLGEVHLIQLPRHDGERVPPDVRPYCASVGENPHLAKVKVRRGRRSHHRRRYLRRTLLEPWVIGAHGWLAELRRTCLRRMESEAPSPDRITLGERIYAHALLSEASLGHRFAGLPPSDSVLARAAAEHVLPLIEGGPAAGGIDVIWIEHTHLLPLAAPLRMRFPGARLVVNSHNVLSELHQAHARIMTTSIARRWHLVEAAACRRVESDGFAGADRVFCCSEDDRERILRIAPAADVHVWKNGVDAEFFVSMEARDPTPRLLLPGSMRYVPNLDGAVWFVREILPLIRRRIPECRLGIAGSGAARTCEFLAEEFDHVEVHSDVPDMRPYFSQAWAVIVPLRAGSGTRLKILEAMSMERPVVSTTIGAEGIHGEAGRYLLLADGAEAFAEAVVSLLEDGARRSAMGSGAREFVREHYDWDRLGASALSTMSWDRNAT